MEQNEPINNPYQPPSLPASPPALPLGLQAGSCAVSQDDRNMGMLVHLLALLTGFLGVLIIWLVKKTNHVLSTIMARRRSIF